MRVLPENTELSQIHVILRVLNVPALPGYVIYTLMCTQTSAFDFLLPISISSKTSPNPKAVYPQTQNFTPKSWKGIKMDTNHCGTFTINHVLNLGLIA